MEVMQDQEWSEPIPMLSWAIEHPTAGIILVDAGEHPRALHLQSYPALNRTLNRNMIRLLEPFEPALDAQLQTRGIRSSDVQHIIVTHLHQDHVGHLGAFPKAKIWVSRTEFEATQSPFAFMKGYWPALFPDGFRPELVDHQDGAFHNFADSKALFENIHVVSTPGHAPGHQSVIVESQGKFVVLAGDVTPTLQHLELETVDMVSAAGDPKKAKRSKQQMRQFVQEQNALYLPSHCPTAMDRLTAFQTQKTLA